MSIMIMPPGRTNRPLKGMLEHGWGPGATSVMPRGCVSTLILLQSPLATCRDNINDVAHPVPVFTNNVQGKHKKWCSPCSCLC